MSVTSSIPRIKILNSQSSSTTTTASCCSSSFKLSPTRTTKLNIRCSQTEGPIRRPMSPPPLREKPSMSPPSPSPQPPPPPPPSSSSPVGESVITLEFQRQKARELQEYFKKKKLEEASQGPVFGFVPKNEIGNGRWAMFGFAVGMLTEYATGSDFVDQVKILLSNFGILDLE